MATTHGPIQRILIVGGGSAGWMTAAFLNRFLHGAGCTISLVESVKLETVGVGEGSGPDLVRFLRALRFDEARFMEMASATYKLATRFTGWTGPDSAYWHPFGLCGGMINDIDVFHYWLKAHRAGRLDGPYSSFSLQALAAERDLAPRPLQGPSPIMESGAYGYHLDLAGFADMVREIAIGEGVNHLFDDVKHVVRAGSEMIEHVETKTGRTLAADLFIDCTIGELTDAAWIDWSPFFLCDRAVLLPLPRDVRMPPYTQATAMMAGWMGRVPISHRVGCAYYYSNAHRKDDEAARELLAQAGSARAASAAPRYIPLRRGRRRDFWTHNCVALGPAAGALEPLEATDGLLVRSLETLLALFPDRTCNPVLSRTYNERMAALYDGVRDFALMHYLLSPRTDEPFWRDCKAVTVPDSLRAILELHDESGIVPPGLAFPETSYHHVLAGNNRLPRRPSAAADALDFEKVCAIFASMRAQNDAWLAMLPSHRELIGAIHRPAV